MNIQFIVAVFFIGLLVMVSESGITRLIIILYRVFDFI